MGNLRCKVNRLTPANLERKVTKYVSILTNGECEALLPVRTLSGMGLPRSWERSEFVSLVCSIVRFPHENLHIVDHSESRTGVWCGALVIGAIGSYGGL
jgi:hypothetical protein